MNGGNLVVMVFDERRDDPCTVGCSFHVHGGFAIGFGPGRGPFGLVAWWGAVASAGEFGVDEVAGDSGSAAGFDYGRETHRFRVGLVECESFLLRIKLRPGPRLGLRLHLSRRL